MLQQHQQKLVEINLVLVDLERNLKNVVNKMKINGIKFFYVNYFSYISRVILIIKTKQNEKSRNNEQFKTHRTS